MHLFCEEDCSVCGVSGLLCVSTFSGMFLRGEYASWELFVVLWADQSREGESANVLYSSCKTKREVQFIVL